MLRLTFTETEAQALSHERFHHSHPRVRRKMEALWLKSQGLAHQDIAQLVNVSGKTLRGYFQEGCVRGKCWSLPTRVLWHDKLVKN